MSILELRGTGYTYRTQYQQVEALKGVSYSFETGKLHAIMGRSGSGKTTLLSLMAGLDLPTAGQVLFEGTPTAEMDLERYRREKAAALVERAGLPSSVLNRFPTMLSGGEQQRVAIARALGMETRLLLADEPTGNLDVANGENVLAILEGLAHEEDYCVVVVTHDPAIGVRADALMELRDGAVV